MRRIIRLLFLVVMVASLTACQSAYYKTMESVGYHKRDILVDRVEDTREANQDAKEQFADALERFRSVVQVDGGELEERYDALNSEYEDCEDRAETVRKRIANVEDVAEALFREWKEEIGQYTSASLRSKSRKVMNDTKTRYNRLIRSMKRASAKMDPVLAAFKDQVLFLKHNLNARAVASLKGELSSIRSDVSVLIRDMERSIKEADSFIKSMESGK